MRKSAACMRIYGTLGPNWARPYRWTLCAIFPGPEGAIGIIQICIYRTRENLRACMFGDEIFLVAAPLRREIFPPRHDREWGIRRVPSGPAGAIGIIRSCACWARENLRRVRVAMRFLVAAPLRREIFPPRHDREWGVDKLCPATEGAIGIILVCACQTRETAGRVTIFHRAAVGKAAVANLTSPKARPGLRCIRPHDW